MSRPIMKSERKPADRAKGNLEELLARVPPEIRERFDDEQRDALAKATEQFRWGSHPLNIRITLPTPFGSYFLVMIGGPERRSRERRRFERTRNPLWTWGNSVILVPLTAVMFAGGMVLAMTIGDFIKGLF